jgi:hypothetical protein
MTNIGGVDAAAVKRAEDGRAGAGPQAPPTVQPARQERGGLLVNTDCPRLVAFTVTHPQCPCLEVYVAQLERQGF